MRIGKGQFIQGIQEVGKTGGGQIGQAGDKDSFDGPGGRVEGLAGNISSSYGLAVTSGAVGKDGDDNEILRDVPLSCGMAKARAKGYTKSQDFQRYQACRHRLLVLQKHPGVKGGPRGELMEQIFWAENGTQTGCTSGVSSAGNAARASRGTCG